MIIDDNLLVSVTYQLRTDHENGEIIETVEEPNPLKFLFGQGMLLPKFEENLSGKKTGDAFAFTLQAEDAYGLYTEEDVIDLPMSVFEVEGRVDPDLIQIGNSIPMMDSYGNRLTGVVRSVTDSSVKMDFNHPLAGKALHFSGKIVGVKVPDENDLSMFSHSCSSCGGGCEDGSCH